MAKLTIKELKALKGKRQLTIVNVSDINLASACAEAGVDIIVIGRRQAIEMTLSVLPEIRRAVPDILITAVMPIDSCKISDEAAIRDAVRLMEGGADLIYATGARPERIQKMTKQFIPCVSHLGLVPYHCSWTGGYCAVGKTGEEAKQLFELAMELNNAGVVCAEFECIPHQLATYISSKVDYLTYSMGSGSGCDGQYLFACDLLGSHNGHYPRHSKTYDNFYKRSVEVFKEFINDVNTGIYPEKKHMVNIKEEEYQKFLNLIKE